MKPGGLSVCTWTLCFALADRLYLDRLNPDLRRSQDESFLSGSRAYRLSLDLLSSGSPEPAAALAQPALSARMVVDSLLDLFNALAAWLMGAQKSLDKCQSVIFLELEVSRKGR